jgi:hypothetical protein
VVALATRTTDHFREVKMQPICRFPLRRGFLLAAVAFALAVAVDTPTAALAQEGLPGGVDTVTGSGLHRGSPQPGIEVDVAAISGPFGENPRGRLSVRVDDGSGAYSGQVTCLTTVGSTASVGIVVDRITVAGPAAPPRVGVEQMYNFVDGGTPGRQGDFIQGYPFDSFPPTFCAFFGAVAPVERGNYVVRDAAP